jgi:hypothetical protein
MTSEHFLVAEHNGVSLYMLDITMWLDGANGKVGDCLEPQKRHCGQAGSARPCGYEL